MTSSVVTDVLTRHSDVIKIIIIIIICEFIRHTMSAAG